MTKEAFVTRFAPSPTGRLHLGHVYSAWFAFNEAKKSGGKFILRIEDIDPIRCKPEYIKGIIEDLRWLGFPVEDNPRIQSEHLADFSKALKILEDKGLVYPCFCSRKEIKEEIARAGNAPHGPEGELYPATCRNLSKREVEQKKKQGLPYALRLNMVAAQELALRECGSLMWHDLARGKFIATPIVFGDIVLARKDVPATYHLAVTVDDDLQGVNLVTRGEDLLMATHIHRLLQALLGLKVPQYLHHSLLLGGDGKKFSKRDNSVCIKDLREQGLSPSQVMEMAIL